MKNTYDRNSRISPSSTHKNLNLNNILTTYTSKPKKPPKLHPKPEKELQTTHINSHTNSNDNFTFQAFNPINIISPVNKQTSTVRILSKSPLSSQEHDFVLTKHLMHVKHSIINSAINSSSLINLSGGGVKCHANKICLNKSNKKFFKKGKGTKKKQQVLLHKKSNNNIHSKINSKQISSHNHYHNNEDNTLNSGYGGDYLKTEPTPSSSTANTTKQIIHKIEHNNNNNNNYYQQRKIKSSCSKEIHSRISSDSESFTIAQTITRNQLFSFVVNDTPSNNIHEIPYKSSSYFMEHNNYINAFSANTFKGTACKENENRIAIAPNLSKVNNSKTAEWPSCSIFAVFDGYGGITCSNYLKENLIKYIIQNEHFPNNPTQAIKQGIDKAEDEFIQHHISSLTNDIGKCGSSIVIALIINSMLYIANVGDSPALITYNDARNIRVLTTEHSPLNLKERKRIEENGGEIYQEKLPLNQFIIDNNNILNDMIYLLGPLRVIPGNVRTTRTIGNINIKRNHKKNKVIIHKPSIIQYDLNYIDNNNEEYLILGNSGLFEHVKHNDIIKCLHSKKVNHIGDQCNLIIKTALDKNCLDNISIVLISLKRKDILTDLTETPREREGNIIESILPQKCYTVEPTYN